ncbi:MAG TPA: Dyp-type peroxidase [Solirubrobacteraceae bacterium]|nr:Dyp-type peroxidase [Solirubrobacteraceae bacterium]
MPRNLPRRRSVKAEIDLADIQGDLLRGYTYACAAYLFLRIDDPGRARELMTRMLPQVSTAEPWDDGPPPTALHVAFTYAGLEALDLPDALLASFPDEFREGMAARAERLGDRGPSAPSRWEPGLGTGEAHVLVTLYGLDEARLAAGRDALRGVGEGAVTLVHEQRASALDGGRDHFGFVDGIAQPAIEGSGVAPRPGDGQPDGAGRWRPVRTGEFLHGYLDEDGLMPEAPAAPFERNGTFAVYRKLAMDVAAFRRYVAEAGFPGGPDLLAAKIVGRWADGTPLVRSPERPDAALAADPATINDFSYARDGDGLRCPLGAHIRRANPRDARGFFDGRLSNRHRIVRRGRPYGSPLAPGALEDDGVERGLVFVCFNAGIWRQFETVQALWIDDGDPFGLGHDKDFLVGEPHGTEGKMTIQGRPPFFLKPQPRFVTMRGGEYLFRPSMSGLRWLASGGR